MTFSYIQCQTVTIILSYPSLKPTKSKQNGQRKEEIIDDSKGEDTIGRRDSEQGKVRKEEEHLGGKDAK